MDTIAGLSIREEHLKGKYFFYDGCLIFPDNDPTETDDRLLRLAADVLVDIYENMKESDT